MEHLEWWQEPVHIYQVSEKLGSYGKADEISQNDVDATIAQDAQKGSPARPQRAKRRGVRFGTLSL